MTSQAGDSGGAPRELWCHKGAPAETIADDRGLFSRLTVMIKSSYIDASVALMKGREAVSVYGWMYWPSPLRSCLTFRRFRSSAMAFSMCCRDWSGSAGSSLWPDRAAMMRAVVMTRSRRSSHGNITDRCTWHKPSTTTRAPCTSVSCDASRDSRREHPMLLPWRHAVGVTYYKGGMPLLLN